MNPLAITGVAADTLALFNDLLRAKGYEPWVVWDSTIDPPPPTLEAATQGQVITFKACAYAAECMILSTRKILDRTNSDCIWIVEVDDILAKEVPCFKTLDEQNPDEDVLLGVGYSRFSRKSLERISNDFGSGLDYASLSVRTLESA